MPCAIRWPVVVPLFENKLVLSESGVAKNLPEFNIRKEAYNKREY
jgi:hypothetical protein